MTDYEHQRYQPALPRPPRAVVQGSIVLLTILAVVCALPPAVADASTVTKQDVIDAILDPLIACPDCDLNGDGQVDAVDLVCFEYQCYREAGFELTRNNVDEGVGVAQVRVLFEVSFTGTLNFSVSGTASGADYVFPGGSVAVNGTFVDIPVTIVDDTEMSEELETVVLTIEPGAGYGLGSSLEHQLVIVDNDAAWLGTMETRGGGVNFTMHIAHSPSGYTAQLVGGDDGTIPAGTFPATIALSETSFAASVPNVVPSVSDPNATYFGAEVTRTLEFNPAIGSSCAAGGVDDPVFAPSCELPCTLVVSGACTANPAIACQTSPECPAGDSCQTTLITGLFCETMEFAGRPGLARANTGNFTLSKAPPRPSTAGLTLTQVGP